MTEPKLKTTRAIREKPYATTENGYTFATLCLALGEDAITLEDELARVRDLYEMAGLEATEARHQRNRAEAAEKERDKLREVLDTHHADSEMRTNAIRSLTKERDTLREELARVDGVGARALMENLAMREELESARLVVDACLSQQKDRWDLETMAMKHRERYGDRE